jgi:Tfp pilus assembly protein PilF
VIQHESDAAFADFDRAIAICPEFALAYLTRGLLFRMTGNLDRAMADYDHAIALDPNMPDAFAARGDVYRGKGDLDQACRRWTSVPAHGRC